MLLPLRIRTHISCEETLYGSVCSMLFILDIITTWVIIHYVQ
jgi:hypothetical protein